MRRLFLDDDPNRAAEFLAVYPDAVWVETASACIDHLVQPWDEIHLDHDLNGEQFVDFGRDDCGMAVIRWLEAEPRLHLREARFIIHSHNAVAAYLMTLQLKNLGLQAVASPFGMGRWKPAPPPRPGRVRRLLARLLGPRRVDLADHQNGCSEGD